MSKIPAIFPLSYNLRIRFDLFPLQREKVLLQSEYDARWTQYHSAGLCMTSPPSLSSSPRTPGYSDVEDFNILRRPVTVHDFAELSNEHYFGVMTIYRGKSMQLVIGKNGCQNL